MHEYVLDGVIGAQCYFQVGAFKQIGDEGSLFAYVSESGPFLCSSGRQFFVGGGGGDCL